jgi:hypothetical protein
MNNHFIHVGSGVAPLQHALKLFISPRIQIDRLDFADVCAHATVNTRASASLVSARHLTYSISGCLPNADEDAQVPTGPSRVCRHLSASMSHRSICLVRLFLLQSAQLLLPSNLTKLFNVCWFCIVLSGPAGLRDMAAVVRRLVGGVVCGVAILNCSTKSECNCARGCRGVWL